MPTNTDPTTMTPFGDITLSTRMATAAETAAVAAAAAQTAVESITQELGELVSRAYKYVGSAASIAAISYPSGKTKANGDVWNITAAFTLDNVDYPAGTDVAWIANESETGGGHWNALGGRTFDDSGTVKSVVTDTDPVSPTSGVIDIHGEDGITVTKSGYTSTIMIGAGDLKTKLDGIASGAQVNVIEGVKLAGASSALTPSSKVVTIPDAVATGATGATNGLMTAADKAKLNGIAANADVSTITGIKLAGASSNLTPASKVVTIPNAVGTGTGATNGLMTAADKTKLDGVAAGAQVNVIESIDTWDSQTLTPSSKTVTLPKGDGKGSGLVSLSDATNGTGVDENSGTAATPKAVADALAAAKSYADGITPDLSSRIKKATVKGKIDSPPSTLSNLPSNAANLTLNQILNALYAGASESES